VLQEAEQVSQDGRVRSLDGLYDEDDRWRGPGVHGESRTASRTRESSRGSGGGGRCCCCRRRRSCEGRRGSRGSGRVVNGSSDRNDSRFFLLGGHRCRGPGLALFLGFFGHRSRLGRRSSSSVGGGRRGTRSAPRGLGPDDAPPSQRDGHHLLLVPRPDPRDVVGLGLGADELPRRGQKRAAGAAPAAVEQVARRELDDEAAAAAEVAGEARDGPSVVDRVDPAGDGEGCREARRRRRPARRRGRAGGARREHERRDGLKRRPVCRGQGRVEPLGEASGEGVSRCGAGEARALGLALEQGRVGGEDGVLGGGGGGFVEEEERERKEER